LGYCGVNTENNSTLGQKIQDGTKHRLIRRAKGSCIVGGNSKREVKGGNGEGAKKERHGA